MTIRVGLVGCGAWGQNVLRTLVASRARVVAVADASAAARSRAASQCDARVVASLDEVLAAGVDAVVLATPSPTHGSLALRALEAGADVLVEKPLAMSVDEAERCVARAATLGRVGMVGHLLRYHPAIVALVELARAGELGELRRFHASRLSIQGDRAVSPLWTLGPHDLSILLALDASPLASIVAREVGDQVVVDARLGCGVLARIDLGRSHPTKERRLTLTGARRAVLFDDVRAPDRLTLADATSGAAITELRVAWREPLAVEIEHFLACVADRTTPRTPLDEGAAVVRALARAESAALTPLAAEAR